MYRNNYRYYYNVTVENYKSKSITTHNSFSGNIKSLNENKLFLYFIQYSYTCSLLKICEMEGEYSSH